MLDTDRLESFGGGKANTIIRIVKPPRLHEDPQWTWHTPNSVSFRMVGEIEVVGDDTTIDTDSQVVEVRLYRDDMKLPWKTFLATPREKTTLSSRKTTAEELRNTPRLRQRFAEEEAKAAAAKLPKVELPAFATHDELAMFVHKVMREGPRDRAEAVLRALYSPRNHAAGSAILLNANAEQELQRALDSAFGAKTSYAQQYCPAPVTENRGAKNRTYFIGVRPNIISEVVSEVAGGGYQDGVKVGERLMLSDLSIRVTDDADTLAYIASFSDPKKLCPLSGGTGLNPQNRRNPDEIATKMNPGDFPRSSSITAFHFCHPPLPHIYGI